MSILDQVQNPTPEVPNAQRAANRLINITRQTYQQMVNAFNQGAIIFWKNPTGASPQEVASYLGTNAAEIFQLHYQLGQLLQNVKPESIAEGASLIGQFTINQDGTVTVTSQPQQ